MAVFSGRIVDAYYSNPELTTVELLYEADDTQREKGMEVVAHHLVVNEEDSQFQDLLKEWSYEQIDEATKARNEATRDEFRIAFHNYATEHGLYQHGNPDVHAETLKKVYENPRTPDDLVQGSMDMIFNFDPENEHHKEDLFKLKLKMFDQEHVEKSDAKAKKTEIRKASTPVEAIVAYHKFKK